MWTLAFLIGFSSVGPVLGIDEEEEPSCAERLSFGQMVALAMIQNLPTLTHAVSTWVSMGLQFSAWQQYFKAVTTPRLVGSPDCVIKAEPCVLARGNLLPPVPFTYPPATGMGAPLGAPQPFGPPSSLGIPPTSSLPIAPSLGWGGPSPTAPPPAPPFPTSTVGRRALSHEHFENDAFHSSPPHQKSQKSSSPSHW